jgi:hypothetical protein
MASIFLAHVEIRLVLNIILSDQFMGRSLVHRNAFRIGSTSDACMELVGDVVGRRRVNTQSKALVSRGEKNTRS